MTLAKQNKLKVLKYCNGTLKGKVRGYELLFKTTPFYLIYS